ncbi:MAG: 50S ribosomal protein L24e [Candidatus Thermoplasmatota archaeon]|jgi:large subunit ribosomal protein L24e|nr:50S ribosomal protein L24e [Candidatus Thermoplasmatota archaeon]MCL5785180.1 50S ribosomal protein L24e [Candidatus Thermoplasmatota archaeon]
MAVRTCNFCGKDIEPGSGTIYVRKDGSILSMCSRKCRVNYLVLGRVSRRVRWTGEFSSIKSSKGSKKRSQKH